MRCLVLGGGGFIGSHLSDTLLASDHEVTIFDRPDARYLENARRQGVNIFVGDYLNPDELRLALANHDVLYHLVSTTVPQTSNDDPVYDIQSNVLGTLRLLDEVRKAQINRIVFLSSGGTVYGVPREIPIRENHPTDPTSSYGIGKLMIEKFLYLYWTLYELDYCILRVANAYGPRQPITATQGVISAFLDRAMHQHELIVWGDGSIIRDYIYVSDIVAALEKAATYTGVHRIFNIGAGQGHSLNDIIEGIQLVVQQPLLIKYLSGRRFDVPVNILDISRAKTALDWHPMVSLQEGISRTYEWTRQNDAKS
jgi:UDP-glucose 4-epimerase